MFIKTSGAAQISAASLLVLPLSFNERVYGVMEVIYVQKLEKQYLELLKVASRNIATALESIYNNTRTKALLEESYRQTEMLRSAEEELRQNLEELQATQEMVESKQQEVEEIVTRYEQILEGCVDCVISISQEGIIDFFNQAAERLWGYDRNEVMGKNVKTLMPQEHSHNHDQYLHNYMTTHVPQVIGKGRKVEALTKSGELVPIFLTLSEARLKDGQHVFTAFIKDLRYMQIQ
ncbi:PAS domain S-box protein [Eisenibacter elegans]|uniref:PAS domain S-box protein n=1 Tax=Eisenibacter elegans TaxID=997 RepID=UPI000478C730|nr:PAS domain S-box protein [Eisenibacter elegans]